jgi:putative ABC transport system permease protein
MLALFREISLRHWIRSPLRSSLVMFGIALSVALYIATTTAAGSMLASFSEFVNRVAGRANLTVEGPGLGVRGELVAEIADVPDVAHAASCVEIAAQAPELGESLLVLGVDFLGDLHFLPFDVEAGEQRVIEDPLAFVNDPTALLVSARFAAKHKLSKDSRLQLLTSEGKKDFFVRGIVADSGPATSFGGQVAVMFLDAAQVSFARGTFVDRIDIAVAPGADVEVVRERVQKLVGDELTVQRPERLGAELRALVKPLHAGLRLSGILGLLVGGFLVYNAVGVAVAQRRREIGLLRALGVTRKGTVLLFATEAGMLALPGIAIGLLLGRLLARYSTAEAIDTLNRLYAAVPQVEPELTPQLALQGGGAGLLTAVVAAWWPARRASKTDPALVLRGAAAVERSRIPIFAMAAAGIALAGLAWVPYFSSTTGGGALALLFNVLGGALITPATIVLIRRLLVRPAEALFGIPARLGLDYVQRTLGRSAVNVLALMAAVSLSVSVGGWLTSFKSTLGRWADQMSVGDLTVTQGSPILDRRHVPFNAATTDRIARVPGIESIQRLRMIDQKTHGLTLRLVATETDVMLRLLAKRGRSLKVVRGAPLEENALTDKPRVLISENAAHKLKLDVGQALTLRTLKGEVSFEVRAVVVDYSSESGAVFFDRRFFLEHWAEDSADNVFVFLASGADPDVVADGIRKELGGGGSIFVTKSQAMREQIGSALESTFAGGKSVELVTLLVALMGVIGTMAAAVIDRLREIGMLRAIGATTRQVALSIVIEAGFLGFCAAVIGAGVGAIHSKLFLNTMFFSATGWHIEFLFPWADAARVGGLVVATAALAGGLPAWRAARSDVTAAIACE